MTYIVYYIHRETSARRWRNVKNPFYFETFDLFQIVRTTDPTATDPKMWS